MDEQNPQEKGQSKPVKTWFIERTGDGFVFATDELDAWNLLTNKSNWVRHDFKIIGVSNGETYFNILRNGRNEMNQLIETKEKLSSDLLKYQQTEERLRFVELRDNTDEMVKKVTALTDDLRKQISDIDQQLANFNKILVKRAFDAELEIARGHIEFPSNHDVITPVKSDREKILANLKV